MQGEHGERDRQSPPLTAGTILLTTEESLRALNASMAAGGFDDVAMSRMRPNLVVPPPRAPATSLRAKHRAPLLGSTGRGGFRLWGEDQVLRTAARVAATTHPAAAAS